MPALSGDGDVSKVSPFGPWLTVLILKLPIDWDLPIIYEPASDKAALLSIYYLF